MIRNSTEVRVIPDIVVEQEPGRGSVRPTESVSLQASTEVTTQSLPLARSPLLSQTDSGPGWPLAVVQGGLPDIAKIPYLRKECRAASLSPSWTSARIAYSDGCIQNAVPASVIVTRQRKAEGEGVRSL